MTHQDWAFIRAFGRPSGKSATKKAPRHPSRISQGKMGCMRQAGHPGKKGTGIVWRGSDTRGQGERAAVSLRPLLGQKHLPGHLSAFDLCAKTLGDPGRDGGPGFDMIFNRAAIRLHHCFGSKHEAGNARRFSGEGQMARERFLGGRRSFATDGNFRGQGDTRMIEFGPQLRGGAKPASAGGGLRQGGRKGEPSNFLGLHFYSVGKWGVGGGKKVFTHPRREKTRWLTRMAERSKVLGQREVLKSLQAIKCRGVAATGRQAPGAFPRSRGEMA